MRLSDRTYTILKWTCLIALPALAILYITLAKIWGLPFGEEISATINAVALFIGTLIGISQINLNKDAGITTENKEGTNDTDN